MLRDGVLEPIREQGSIRKIRERIVSSPIRELSLASVAGCSRPISFDGSGNNPRDGVEEVLLCRTEFRVTHRGDVQDAIRDSFRLDFCVEHSPHFGDLRLQLESAFAYAPTREIDISTRALEHAAGQEAACSDDEPGGFFQNLRELWILERTPTDVRSRGMQVQRRLQLAYPLGIVARSR